MITSDKEKIPKVCFDLADDLAKRNLEIRRVSYEDITNTCIIDFIDKRTKSIIESEGKEGIIPYGWYISSIEYFIDSGEFSLHLNKVPRREFEEVNIPVDDKNIRVHLDFKEPPRIGVDIAFLKDKDTALSFIDYFFGY